MKMIQVKLRKNNSVLTTWIEHRKQLQIGSLISLKEVDGMWRIEEMYNIMDKTDLKTNWHVGGL